MPTDLHARATQRQLAIAATATDIGDVLAAARAEQDRRHPDPSSVAMADWATHLGAAQHQDVAREALAALRAAEAKIRAALATVTTAADADTFEAELRALLVAAAALRVQLRHAQERVAHTRAVVDACGALAAAAEAEVAAAAERTTWAEGHQQLGVDLRAALATPPLSGLVAAAAAVAGGAGFTNANNRIDALLPAALRARATAREQEAAAASSIAAAHHASAQGELDDLDRALHPVLAETRISTRAFLDAEAALRSYVTGAATELALAETLLARVVAHLDLSPAQLAALDPAANTDGETAADAERDLAAALADLGTAQRVVDDAILGALVDDPNRDPETVQAVIDARAALNDGAVQDPVTTARAAYGAAARADLDRWEVEVPSTLWDAVADFLAAERILDRLASNADRAALVSALDTAQDDLANALDAHDEAVRVGWVAGLVEAGRRGTVAATAATAADRRLQYLRGDGPSGRTVTEL